MKLKQLIEQLNQLAKERPEALEMEVELNQLDDCVGSIKASEISVEFDIWVEKEVILLS